MGFSFRVLGSTVKPRISRAVTPSRGASVASPKITGTVLSLPLIFRRTSPSLRLIRRPSATRNSSSEYAEMPRCRSRDFGNTVKIAPVSAITFSRRQLFFRRRGLAISTVTSVIPMLDFLSLSPFRLNAREEHLGRFDGMPLRKALAPGGIRLGRGCREIEKVAQLVRRVRQKRRKQTSENS